MVTARMARRRVQDILRQAGIEDAGFEAAQLVQHTGGFSRFQDGELTPREEEALLALAARRARREPLQYLLGSWSFLGLELAVGPGVLVPRPETEEVALAAAALLEGAANPTILDLCAGSGAIALGLQSLLPGADIIAVEKETDAFGYLQRNVDAFRQGHPRGPQPVCADALRWHETQPDAAFALLVSNPPYVTAAEYETLAPELRYEPRGALVAQEDGLEFYRAIPRDYRRVLRPGGFLVMEIGAEQGAAVSRLLAENGYGHVTVRRDMAGHDRIVTGVKNHED